MNVNKMQTQEQEIKQIQENYARDLNNIDEIYEELAKNMIVILTQNPSNETWTKEVTLTGNAEVKEGEEVQIVEYAFGAKDSEEVPTTWETAGSTESLIITKTKQIIENGEYIFWVKDSEGEVHKSNKVNVQNIDRINPTVGSVIAKEENNTGTDYKFNTWTDKNIYVEKVDGTDNESGHKITTMTIIKNGLSMGVRYWKCACWVLSWINW